MRTFFTSNLGFPVVVGVEADGVTVVGSLEPSAVVSSCISTSAILVCRLSRGWLCVWSSIARASVWGKQRLRGANRIGQVGRDDTNVCSDSYRISESVVGGERVGIRSWRWFGGAIRGPP